MLRWVLGSQARPSAWYLPFLAIRAGRMSNLRPLFDLSKYVRQYHDYKIFNCDIRQLPEQVFDVRYRVGIVDIPWPYDNPKSGSPRLGGYTYDPMTMEDICGLKPTIDRLFDPAGSILFAWGTWPKLPQFEIVRAAWDWEHVTGFPWIKTCSEDPNRPKYGPGHWVAGCSEYCCIWRRGHVSPPDVENYLGLLTVGGIKHSRKPEDLHEMAETLAGPYIELFARQPRDGWTVVGNELGDWMAENG